MRKFLAIVLTTLLLQACRSKNWHAVFAAGQRFQCNKLTGSERQNCLDSISDAYERYQRKRLEMLNLGN